MLADLREGEFFNQDGSLRKLAILLVVTKVFPFNVDAVKFRKGAPPSLSPLGVIGPPMKTHDRKPFGKTRLPSFVNSGPLSPDCGLTAVAAINNTPIANLSR